MIFSLIISLAFFFSILLQADIFFFIDGFLLSLRYFANIYFLFAEKMRWHYWPLRY